MLHPGFDFQTVRVLCKSCGWFRNIAHSGRAEGKRALVKITRSADPSHILQAEVIEISEKIELSIALQENPGFRDLVAEAHDKGLIKMEMEFLPLLEGQSCPRCKKIGFLELSQIWSPHKGIRY